MPIRAYFLVITPALAAFLWWASWYLQPEPPKVYQTAAASRVAAQTGKPTSATTGAAPAQAATTTPAASEPAPQAGDTKLVASTAVEDTKPVAHTPKPKKRKTARRKPRESQPPAYAYGGGYPYGSSGYYGYQPSFGYGRW